MKLSCTQENLNHGLTTVCHLASKNINLPILNNVLIKTKDSSVILSTTNLEIAISCPFRARIEKEGVFTVPANILSNFISLISPEEKIDIELIGKELIIKSNNQQTKIKGEEASEYPIIPEIKKDNKINLSCQDLKKGLAQVVFAAASNETRIELSGILFNINHNQLVLAATDSYRLAEKKISIKQGNFTGKIIIPQRTIQEVLRVLALSIDGDVDVFITENQVMFQIGQTEIISRLLEGEYPDYTQIIPTSEKTKVTCSKEELIKVIKRAALFSKSGINDVDLHFISDKQILNIKAISNQVGENNSEQQVEIKGENNNIVFNYRYLLDGLQNIDEDRVIIKIIDNASPGIFLGEKMSDYLYIIMPIKQ